MRSPIAVEYLRLLVFADAFILRRQLLTRARLTLAARPAYNPSQWKSCTKSQAGKGSRWL
jgi:hypothetical protein